MAAETLQNILNQITANPITMLFLVGIAIICITMPAKKRRKK